MTDHELGILHTVHELLLEVHQAIAEVKGQNIAMSAQLNEHKADDDRNFRELKRELRGTRKRVDSVTNEVEETGRHELVELRDAKKHWSRFIAATLVAIGTAVVGALISYLATKGH